MFSFIAALVLTSTPATPAVAPAAYTFAPGISITRAADVCPCPGKACTCDPSACVCPGCTAKGKKVETTDDPTWFALRVTVDHGNGRSASGSGTPIHVEAGKTVVLTNAHVVPKADKDKTIRVHAGGKAYPARYVDGSEVRSTGPSTIEILGPDLCLLEVDADLGQVEIAADVPPPGAAVRQWGYGGVGSGGRPVPRSGEVTDSRPYVEPTLVTTIRTISGDSGAGVFNAKAELVGVTWGGDGVTSRGVPLSVVHVFLGRPTVHTLFPRLHARLAARRAAVAAATPPPAVVAPVAPRPPVTQPTPQPAAGGFMYYDPTARVWRIGNSSPAGGCPNGRCPLQPQR